MARVEVSLGGKLTGVPSNVNVHTNKLASETSPYLLQHAHNPVDWYPWGDEALGRAKAEDKPILLSIGYAACHWCHVMERESFEDEATAADMNASFICIKVDREERPEIDAIYMDAVQAMTGHGGWPMTMFLSPDGIPFYGGTYFPPDDRHGLPGFRRVLAGVAEAWRTRKAEIVEQGQQLITSIEASTRPVPSRDPLTNSLISHAVEHIATTFDESNGGFGDAPKFPQAPVLEFLIATASMDLGRSREMLQLTLTKMASGGIYDHLGGGFARYSVDAEWLVPHFEKMLYDNAQLARVYTHAWQLTKDPLFERIALETCDYLIRDLQHPAGPFYASEDADSEGVEGKFYVWSYAEFLQVAPDAADHYSVTPKGNFEGTNILTAQGDPMIAARDRLLAERNKRVRPARDEKILTSWNGLAIAAMAEAGATFGRKDLTDAAVAAADFIIGTCHVDGRLMHSHKDGRTHVLGLLEDYAYLLDGLWALWEATFDPRWIDSCQTLADEMMRLFWDHKDGGLFTTGIDHEKLIVRQKEIVESATPSPNGVASLVLQKLGLITASEQRVRAGTDILKLAHLYMAKAPQASATFLRSLDFSLDSPKEIVIVGTESSPAVTSDLYKTAWQTFTRNRVLAGGPPGLSSPLFEGKTMLDGVPTAYVCENYTCKEPTTSAEVMRSQLS